MYTVFQCHISHSFNFLFLYVYSNSYLCVCLSAGLSAAVTCEVSVKAQLDTKHVPTPAHTREQEGWTENLGLFLYV